MVSVTAESQAGSAAPPQGVAILHRHSGEVLYQLEAPTLRRAALGGVALYGANLEGADLRGADLSGASLLGATLSRARLDDARLHRATLYGADLSGASLKGADLRRTDLRAANFEGADLAGALITGARYGKDTRWPEGFTPHAYGAVAVRSRTRSRRQAPVLAPPAAGEVLIVEDDDTIQSVLACHLRRAGFRVVIARNGREALDRLQSGTHPAVILLDMAMPEMDGWSFRIEQMKDRALASIPVIVCSACYDPLPVAKLARASAYLVKPYDFPLVEATVRRFCEPGPSGTE